MLRRGAENCFLFIDGDMLCFLSCDKCTDCISLWTKRLLNALNVNVMCFIPLTLTALI